MKKSLSKWACSLLVACCMLNLGAQENEYIPSIAPPSPTAAALGKYGEYPVSYHTGTPNISIPIHELAGRKLKVPISISYHASGIKVDEIASNVGLGWSLNAGGVITRSIRGIRDESGTGYKNIGPVPRANDIDFTNQEDLNYLLNLKNGTVEAEPDIFFYNFFGSSGKMFLTDQKEFITDKREAWKIHDDLPNDRITITKEDGSTYIFGTSLDGTPAFESTRNGSSNNGTTAWYLTEAISADKGDTIYFEYFTSGSSEIRVLTHSEYVKIGSTVQTSIPQLPHMTIAHVNVQSIKRISSSKGAIEFNYANDRLDHSHNRLTTIRLLDANNVEYKTILLENNNYFDRNKVATISCNMNYWDEKNKKSLKLTGIKICLPDQNECQEYDFKYNTTQLPPRLTNGQDYWGYANGKDNNLNLIPRIELTHPNTTSTLELGDADRSPDEVSMKAASLEEIKYPTGGTTKFTFEPHYYLDARSQIRTTQFDYGVLALGEGSPSFDPVEIDQVTFRVNENVQARVEWNISAATNTIQDPYVELYDANRTNTSTNLLKYYNTTHSTPLIGGQYVNLVANTDYVLEVRSSKGGGNEIFETSYVRANISWTEEELIEDPAQYEPKMSGGLRISKIENLDSDLNTVSTKSFHYGNGKYGTSQKEVGFSLSFCSQFIVRTHEIYDYNEGGGTSNPGNGQCMSRGRDIYTASSVSAVELGSNNGSTVEYDRVTVYNGTETGNTGKSIYYYERSKSDMADLNYNVPVLSFPTWSQGNLYKEETYRRMDNGTYVIQSQKVNHFKNLLEGKNHGLRVYEYRKYTGCMVDLSDPQQFRPYECGFSYGKRVLDWSESISYDLSGNEILNQTTFYEYDPGNGFLISERTTDSKGNQRSSTYTYPYQSNQLNGASTAEIEALDFMVASNMLAVPIETKQYKGIELLSTKRTVFHLWNDVFAAPYSIQTAMGNNSLTEEIRFNNYNQYGLVESYSVKNSMPTSFVWDQKGVYPLAKVQDATFVSQWKGELEQVGSNHNFGRSGITGESGTATSFSMSHEGTVKLIASLESNAGSIVRVWIENMATGIECADIDLHYNLMSNSHSFTAPAGNYAIKYSGLGGSDLLTGKALVSQAAPILSPIGRYTEVAYIPFDHTDGKVALEKAKSGNYAYQGQFIMDISHMNTGSYTLEYWTSMDGKQWGRQSENISIDASSSSLTLGSAGSYLDEIRLYPAGAQMETYNYTPAGLVKTQTDINGFSTHYGYDSFNRLQSVQDNDRNFLQVHEYNLQQQP